MNREAEFGKSIGCHMAGCGVTHFHGAPPEGYEWRWNGSRNVPFGPNDLHPASPGVMENGVQVRSCKNPWTLHPIALHMERTI